jgi:hypothetical protein
MRDRKIKNSEKREKRSGGFFGLRLHFTIFSFVFVCGSINFLKVGAAGAHHPTDLK